MALIGIVYNKFTGKILRSERMSSTRARKASLYNMTPAGTDTLPLKFRVLKDDISQPLFASNISDIEFQLPRRNIEIAAIFHGGFGDHVIARSLIEGLKRKHGNVVIDAYCYYSPDILQSYPEIRKVTKLHHRVQPRRYAEKLSFKYPCYDFDMIGARYEQGKLAYTKFPQLYNQYPQNLPALLRKFPNRHMAFVRGESAGLKVQLDDIDIVSFPKKEKYVTISGFSNSKIKEWDKWEEVIRYLSQNDIKILQMGILKARLIKGAKDNRGISISDVRTTIANAILHLDNDGGLVHLARAVGTRSIVLFGPTPSGTWGYPENVNIISRVDCPHMPCLGTQYWKSCPYTDDNSGYCITQIELERILNLDAID